MRILKANISSHSKIELTELLFAFSLASLLALWKGVSSGSAPESVSFGIGTGFWKELPLVTPFGSKFDFKFCMGCLTGIVGNGTGSFFNAMGGSFL